MTCAATALSATDRLSIQQPYQTGIQKKKKTESALRGNRKYRQNTIIDHKAHIASRKRKPVLTLRIVLIRRPAVWTDPAWQPKPP